MIQIVLLAFSLSADAFAAAIAKGARFRKLTFWQTLTIALSFGVLESLAPLIGYALGLQFKDAIDDYDHWIAFALLGLLGLRMIWKSFHEENIEGNESAPSWTSVAAAAVGTSIDATVVGITLALFGTNIALTLATIGVVTFAMAFIGLRLGRYIGMRVGSWAEMLGGFGLIAIGANILFTHLTR